jgi:hypothetical protein
MDRGRTTGALRQAPWSLAAAVAVGVLVVSFLVLLGATRWIPGVADCTVTVGDRTVELSTEEAEKAATVSARSIRLRLPARTTSAAVADLLDSSEDDAAVVTAALTGRAQHALSCRHGGADDEERDTLNRVGLTARAVAVRRALDEAFGPQRVGGFAPGGVTSGHMRGSAHYEGRAVDVFFRPVNERNRTRGWALAEYAVAHAERLSVDTVIYDGRIWTSRRGAEGWRAYSPDTSGRTAKVAEILEHRDHVHVDVAD